MSSSTASRSHAAALYVVAAMAELRQPPGSGGTSNPGWYRDPWGRSAWRWWDGWSWTGWISPPESAGPGVVRQLAAEADGPPEAPRAPPGGSPDAWRLPRRSPPRRRSGRVHGVGPASGPIGPRQRPARRAGYRHERDPWSGTPAVTPPPPWRQPGRAADRAAGPPPACSSRCSSCWRLSPPLCAVRAAGPRRLSARRRRRQSHPDSVSRAQERRLPLRRRQVLLPLAAAALVLYLLSLPGARGARPPSGSTGGSLSGRPGAGPACVLALQPHPDRRAAGSCCTRSASGAPSPPTGGLPAYYSVAYVAMAIVAGVVEEIVVLGYLVRRLEQLGLQPVCVVVIAVAVRGSYHLYYGWGVLPIVVWATVSVLRVPAFPKRSGPSSFVHMRLGLRVCSWPGTSSKLEIVVLTVAYDRLHVALVAVRAAQARNGVRSPQQRPARGPGISLSRRWQPSAAGHRAFGVRAARRSPAASSTGSCGSRSFASIAGDASGASTSATLSPSCLRVARNLGRETTTHCPICEEANLVHVSFAFGPRLPSSGRALAPGEITKLTRNRPSSRATSSKSAWGAAGTTCCGCSRSAVGVGATDAADELEQGSLKSEPDNTAGSLEALDGREISDERARQRALGTEQETPPRRSAARHGHRLRRTVGAAR